MGIVVAVSGAKVAATTENVRSIAVSAEVFERVIEDGSKQFVALCSSQGRTEAEELEYGEAAAGVVEKTLAIAAIRGGIKALGGKFKHKARILSKSEATALAKEAYLNKGGKGLVNDNPVSKALDGAKDATTTAKQIDRNTDIIGRVEKVVIGDQKFNSFVKDAPGSMNTALRQRTYLKLQEEGLLDLKGQPTQKAKNEAIMVEPFSKLKNDAIKSELIKLNPNGEWGKYATKSRRIIDGQPLEIHFYMDKNTEKTYLESDFKTKTNGDFGVGIFKPIKKKEVR